MSHPLLRSALIIFCLTRSVTNFNLDLRSAVIKPGPKNTYFGYSVALFRFNRERHFIIGAPLANGSMGVPSAGAIYKCNIERQSGCARIDLDKRGEEVLNGTRSESKQHQWLGATVASSRNGVVLTCAPRYVHFSENLRRKEPVGLCYLSTLSMHTDSFEYSPCRRPDSWGYHRVGSCQAGFAGTISDDGRHFVLTAPGSFYWQGQVYSYSRNDTSYLPSYTAERDASDDDSYFGYSVVYGDFHSDHPGLELAVATPKSFHNLTGKVSILNRQLQPLFEVMGEQSGAYFGYSMASLDMDGDARSDLVVSAPMFANYDAPYDHWEVGRVYVYRHTNQSRLVLQVTLDGYDCRGRFGSSIVNLGDLNRDSYEDLAIGAPYAGPEHNGLVYVYNGGASGLSSKPSQVIAPEQLPFAGPTLRTFAWSLASRIDLTNDEHPDLLIGAYASDAVVFLRSRPLVDMKVKFEVHPSNISLERPACSKIDGTQVACVTVSVCLAFNGHRSVPNRLRFMWNVRLDVDNRRTFPRMYVVNMNNDRMHVHRGVLALERGRLGQCNKFKAYVEEHTHDYHHPIVLQLDFAIQNYMNLAPTSRLHTPMLNRMHHQPLQTLVRIQHDCGPDNVCIPNLKVDVTKNMESYTLNGAENLLLNVCVSNDGEHAYDAITTLDMPEDVNLVRLHSNRSTLDWHEFRVEQSGRNRLEISLGNPMIAFTKTCFQLEFNTRNHAHSTFSDLTFIFKVFSSNFESEQTQADNVLVIGIPIRLQIELQSFGQSFVDHQPIEYVCSVDDMNESGWTQSGTRNVIFPDAQPIIRHVYYLRNRGPSTLQQANLTIFWPEYTIERRPLFELIAQPKIRVINQQTVSFSHDSKKNDVESNVRRRLPVRVQCEHIDLHAIIDRTNEQIESNQMPMTTDYIESADWFNFRRLKRTVHDRPANAKMFFDCDVSRCRKIECWIRDMAANSEIIIEMAARPWNQTLKEVQITQFPITSVTIVHLPHEITNQLTSQMVLPLVVRVSTIVRLIELQFDDVISLHSILIAICSGISLLTFIVFVLERMDFFRSSNRFQMAKCQITDQIPRSTHSFEVYFNSPTRLTECNERVESSSDRSQLSNHSDFDFSAEATCVDRSFDQMSPLSCDRDFESTFDPMSDCDEYTRCLHNNDRQSQHHQDHHLHHHRHHCDHDHAQSESPRCSRLSRSSPDDCELHTLRRSRLSVRQLCREKLYDHLHYSRNNETYNFYRDLSRHEPHCPFYASHRSLVSYK